MAGCLGRWGVEAKVDRPAPGVAGVFQIVRTGDESSAADVGIDQSATFGFGEGAGHGPDADTEGFGEVTLGGESLSRAQAAVFAITLERLDDLDVDRIAGAVELRLPFDLHTETLPMCCHYDNDGCIDALSQHNRAMTSAPRCGHRFRIAGGRLGRQDEGSEEGVTCVANIWGESGA